MKKRFLFILILICLTCSSCLTIVWQPNMDALEVKEWDQMIAKHKAETVIKNAKLVKMK